MPRPRPLANPTPNGNGKSLQPKYLIYGLLGLASLVGAGWTVFGLPLKIKSSLDNEYLPRKEATLLLAPIQSDLEGIKKDLKYIRRSVVASDSRDARIDRGERDSNGTNR